MLGVKPESLSQGVLEEGGGMRLAVEWLSMWVDMLAPGRGGRKRGGRERWRESGSVEAC